MITKLTKTLALSLLLIGTIACGSDDEGPDTEGPTVDITTPNETDLYKRGSALPLDAVFSDNRELATCVISISYVESSPAAQLKGIGTPWTPAENGDKETITFTEKKEEKITIPQLFGEDIEGACLGGTYKLTFVMTDATGNSSTKEVNIQIGG
ncbi:DUF4625 domain-containing protein [Carboxylicivirga marina]|uniref:DUF4625 domain-containing protein n=1 Tax=Carboxylicivirga marina TaxID=2800988 RepID=UPI0025942630|nr:DUF4625 domain-containing protein [uncultured Carboxylicivirga sp.]